MMGFQYIVVVLNFLLCAASGKKSSSFHSFPISPFEVNLFIDPFPTDQSELIILGNNLKDVTNVHLFQTFENEVNKAISNSGGNSPVSTIALDLVVHNDSEEEIVRVNMSGTVTFHDMAGISFDSAVVKDMVNIAFNSTAAMDDFFSLLAEKIPSVESVLVETNLSTLNSPIAIPTVNTVIEDESSMNDADEIKGGSSAITVSMSVALIALVAGLFAYVRRDQLSYKKGNLLIENDEQSEFSEEDGFGRLLGELELDEDSYASFEDEDGIQFVPVPAKIDEEQADKATRALKDEDIQPRRFVKPGSPFELLYGASFSHRDHTKVAKAHGAKYKQPKSMKVSGKRIRKKAPLKPMVSINEGDEEEAKPQTSEYFFPQFMSSLSSFLKEKTTTSNPDATTEDCEQEESEPFVYRDFPRHDGSPCVLFTDVENVDWKEDSENGLQSPQPSSNSDAAALINKDAPPEKAKEIDSFVDKLENLMAARCRQYEERKQLEKEMASRKEDYLANRAKSIGEESTSLPEGEEERDDSFEEPTNLIPNIDNVLDTESLPVTLVADNEDSKEQIPTAEDLESPISMTKENEVTSNADASCQPDEVPVDKNLSNVTNAVAVDEKLDEANSPIENSLVPLSLKDEEDRESADSDLKTSKIVVAVDSESIPEVADVNTTVELVDSQPIEHEEIDRIPDATLDPTDLDESKTLKVDEVGNGDEATATESNPIESVATLRDTNVKSAEPLQQQKGMVERISEESKKDEVEEEASQNDDVEDSMGSSKSLNLNHCSETLDEDSWNLNEKNSSIAEEVEGSDESEAVRTHLIEVKLTTDQVLREEENKNDGIVTTV